MSFFFVYFDLLPHKWGPLRKYVRVLRDICKVAPFLHAAPFVALIIKEPKFYLREYHFYSTQCPPAL
jgi:hypothetical protein